MSGEVFVVAEKQRKERRVKDHRWLSISELASIDHLSVIILTLQRLWCWKGVPRGPLRTVAQTFTARFAVRSEMGQFGSSLAFRGREGEKLRIKWIFFWGGRNLIFRYFLYFRCFFEDCESVLSFCISKICSEFGLIFVSEIRDHR